MGIFLKDHTPPYYLLPLWMIFMFHLSRSHIKSMIRENDSPLKISVTSSKVIKCATAHFMPDDFLL